jgi:hypothetical protein
VRYVNTYTLVSSAWPRQVKEGLDDELYLNVSAWDAPTDAPLDGSREPIDGRFLWSSDFGITWTTLSGKSCPKVSAFSDAWRGLAQVTPILVQMDGTDPSPDEIIETLSSLGWIPSEYHNQHKAQLARRASEHPK